MLISNAGSGAIPAAGDGWTNTYEGAEAEARDWHRRLIADGIRDVELELPGRPDDDGRWTFTFRHTVTGVKVHLNTPGLSDWRAYNKEHVFPPRMYWNGSSSSIPTVEDWAAPGFEVVQTFRPA